MYERRYHTKNFVPVVALEYPQDIGATGLSRFTWKMAMELCVCVCIFEYFYAVSILCAFLVQTAAGF